MIRINGFNLIKDDPRNLVLLDERTDVLETQKEHESSRVDCRCAVPSGMTIEMES